MLVASPCDILHGLLPSFCSSLFLLSISSHWVSQRLVSVKLLLEKKKNPPTQKRHHVTNTKEPTFPSANPQKKTFGTFNQKKHTQRKSESWNRGRGIRWRCKSIFCNQQWIFGLFGTNMGTYCRWSDGGGKLAIGRKVYEIPQGLVGDLWGGDGGENESFSSRKFEMRWILNDSSLKHVER